MHAYIGVCVCVRACVHACVHVCVCVRVVVVVWCGMCCVSMDQHVDDVCLPACFIVYECVIFGSMIQCVKPCMSICMHAYVQWCVLCCGVYWWLWTTRWFSGGEKFVTVQKCESVFIITTNFVYPCSKYAWTLITEKTGNNLLIRNCFVLSVNSLYTCYKRVALYWCVMCCQHGALYWCVMCCQHGALYWCVMCCQHGALYWCVMCWQHGALYWCVMCCLHGALYWCVMCCQHGAVAHAQPGGGNASHLNVVTEKSVQAYITLNRFLQAFIDHVSAPIHTIHYSLQAVFYKVNTNLDLCKSLIWRGMPFSCLIKEETFIVIYLYLICERSD